MEELKKPKQLHLLYWGVIIFIILPIIYVGTNILQNIEEQGTPVVGSRYDSALSPEIDTDQFGILEDSLRELTAVEDVEINLKASTLRITLDCTDSLKDSSKMRKEVVDPAYEKVKEVYDRDTYFTNGTDTKMYDLCIDAFNFIPEEGYDDDQCIVELIKSGAGKPRVFVLTEAKDPKLVEEIVRE